MVNSEHPDQSALRCLGLVWPRGYKNFFHAQLSLA